jgi:hypothetical protein
VEVVRSDCRDIIILEHHRGTDVGRHRDWRQTSSRGFAGFADLDVQQSVSRCFTIRFTGPFASPVPSRPSD